MPDDQIRAYINCKITKQCNAHLYRKAAQFESTLWKPYASQSEQHRAHFKIWDTKLAAGKKLLHALNKCWNSSKIR